MALSGQRRQATRLPRARRVADIMAAARDVFRERGYADALISEIALRADVVEGTIYRYFENKRELLVRVVEDWYEAMLSDYDRQLAGVHGTRNRLRFLIWKHLDTIHREPALCRLVFSELRPGGEYRSTAVFELNRAYTRRTQDIVREAVANGEFRADVPPRLVRDLIYGCIEHQSWAFLRGEGDFQVEQTADLIADVVCRGLAREPRREDGGLPEAVHRLERVAARLEGVAERENRP